MRKHAIPGVLFLMVAAGAGYLYWEHTKPVPVLPGDKEWCDPIRNKPIEEWTQEEALGFATHNCMRWY
jgi:hypothetical protein